MSWKNLLVALLAVVFLALTVVSGGAGATSQNFIFGRDDQISTSHVVRYDNSGSAVSAFSFENDLFFSPEGSAVVGSELWLARNNESEIVRVGFDGTSLGIMDYSLDGALSPGSELGSGSAVVPISSGGAFLIGRDSQISTTHVVRYDDLGSEIGAFSFENDLFFSPEGSAVVGSELWLARNNESEIVRVAFDGTGLGTLDYSMDGNLAPGSSFGSGAAVVPIPSGGAFVVGRDGQISTSHVVRYDNSGSAVSAFSFENDLFFSPEGSAVVGSELWLARNNESEIVRVAFDGTGLGTLDYSMDGNLAPGSSFGSGAAVVSSAVPEPTTALLLTLGLSVLGIRRRHR